MRLVSQRMTTEELEALSKHATVLEQDERGIKVMQLPNGNIFKIFRIRNTISGARLFSYARRFFRNAKRLHNLGIPTVTPQTLYHFENSSNTAVLYQPLIGVTIKQMLKTNTFNENNAKEIGELVARLHQLGVHFRSLHMGNIVLTEEGKLGLIDISDMSIYPWPLMTNTRKRSFKHICRYPLDIQAMGPRCWQLLLESYINNCKLNQIKIELIISFANEYSARAFRAKR